MVYNDLSNEFKKGGQAKKSVENLILLLKDTLKLKANFVLSVQTMK